MPADNAAARSDAPPDKASAGSSTRTIQEQVAAATALAEHATAAAMAQAPEPKSNNTGRSDRSETVPLSDAEKTASAPPNNANNLVALLMARPEIKSVSDLTNKKIAIDDRQSASNDSVRTAIAAAGATEVQLSNGQTRTIDRLISGEVPAAVLTSAYPEAAEWLPEIAGFKIFRIPLAPRSLQARLEPAGSAAAKSDTPPAKIAVSSPMAAAADPSSSRTLRRDSARGARDGCKCAPSGAEGSEQCRSVWSYRSPPAQRYRADSVRADKQHGRPGCPYDGASIDQIGVRSYRQGGRDRVSAIRIWHVYSDRDSCRWSR